MVGTDAERKLYKEQTLEHSVESEVWRSLDAELFGYLVGLHSKPMQIQITI